MEMVIDNKTRSSRKEESVYTMDGKRRGQDYVRRTGVWLKTGISIGKGNWKQIRCLNKENDTKREKKKVILEQKMKITTSRAGGGQRLYKKME
jgi:hypothetical protein